MEAKKEHVEEKKEHRCSDLRLLAECDRPSWIPIVAKALSSPADSFHIEFEDVTAASGGYSGAIERMFITSSTPPSSSSSASNRRTFVVKHTNMRELSIQTSRSLGLAREGLFFSSGLADTVDPHHAWLPFVHYARGCMRDGIKVLLMEDLNQRHGTQAGYFFGAGHQPHEGKNLNELTAAFNGRPEVKKGDEASSSVPPLPSRPLVTAKDITFRAFQLAADLHAAHWMDSKLIEVEDSKKSPSWLRGRGWIRGEDPTGWQTSIDLVASKYEQFKKAPFFSMSEKLSKVVEASFSRQNFAAYVQAWRPPSRCFTLVHGDFHPANMLVVDALPGGSDAAAAATSSPWSLLLVDWEVVGVGSGPQDLGQFMISHASLELRKECELPALHAYYDRLVKLLKENATMNPSWIPSFDDVYREFCFGSIERWVWLTCILLPYSNAGLSTYFDKKMREFMEDHKITEENVGMPRP